MKLKLTLKLWILIFVLTISLITIFGLPPTFLQKGVLITGVESNSTALEEGLSQGQIITHLDGIKIESVEDYTSYLSSKFPSETKQKLIIQTKDSEAILFINSFPKIMVSNIPKTNIKTGLDLSGGARALIQAQDFQLDNSQTKDLAAILTNRFNVYGLSDVKINPISDLTGNNFVLIEIAGATPNDLEELISQQGKFEAKIGEETVFIGGDKDITYVGRTGQDQFIGMPQKSSDGTYFSSFRFTITLSEAAAKRHAEITKDLDLITVGTNRYLSQNLTLFLDGKLVDQLYIGEDLKGRETTQIQISGSGKGVTSEEAVEDAEASMKKLQTILITGSLPYQLEIVKLDTISPLLGRDFINSIFLAGLAALTAVSIIVFIRYRNIKATFFLVMISISEIIIILGIASFINWNLDLPSIAGILATIGTGIDHLIIVLDETHQDKTLSIKQRLKRAFAIILGAYFTSVFSLLPLWWAGAGLLKGFVFTTLIGITTGVLITRPAFIDIVQKIEE